MLKHKEKQPTPIFDLGVLPNIPHCKIIDRKYNNRKNNWTYFISNSYNIYASGWIDEDSII
jgi:hypothetical protein